MVFYKLFMINDILNNGFKAAVVLYEDLYLTPEQEVEKLCRNLDIDYNKQIKKQIGKHAFSVDKNSPVYEKKGNITSLIKWETKLSTVLKDFVLK